MEKIIVDQPITLALQGECKKFIDSGECGISSITGITYSFQQLSRQHEFRGQGEDATLKLGRWQGIDFSVQYNGYIWKLLTELVFFKGELHDPEESCLQPEKETFWYTVLKKISTKRHSAFPILLDVMTKLSHVDFSTKKGTTAVYDDEYRATIATLFLSQEELLKFIKGTTIASIPLEMSARVNVSEAIYNGAIQALNMQKKRLPCHEGVIFNHVEKHGFKYVIAEISIENDEWRDPNDYLVVCEKLTLRGKLLLAFHAQCQKKLLEKNNGPHVLDDKVKGIWRPKEQKLLFEYLAIQKK